MSNNVSVLQPRKRCLPENLYVANIDEQSCDFDWSEHNDEVWRVVVPDFASLPRHLLKMYADCASIDLEQDFDNPKLRWGLRVPREELASFLESKWNEEGSEDPMMNYYYPVHLPGGDHSLGAVEAQFILSVNHLPITVIGFEGEGYPDYALALTGGGMDLTWQICEAYCRLGQVPPAHFWDLPGMAGRGYSQKDVWIMKCIRYGAEWYVTRAKDRVERINKKMREGQLVKRHIKEGKKPLISNAGYVAFGDQSAAHEYHKARPDSWLYEINRGGLLDFRCYFICQTQDAIDALKKKHKYARLSYGQCACTDYPDTERQVASNCPECHGRGPLKRCTDESCGRMQENHDNPLCRFHTIVSQADKEACDAE